jgi:peptide/nickel transport system ATP-binding protein
VRERFRYDVRIAAGPRELVSIRDFTIPAGRITFLFGESGIGKSLIARAIYGLLNPDELDVSVNGEEYRRYAAQPDTEALRAAGFFVFQEPSSHLNPLLPLGVQLREGSLAAAEDSSALEALWEPGDRATPAALLPVYPKPYRPSGGEKQRMFLAMALMKMDLVAGGRLPDASPEHALFVFDEPTGSLDNRARDTFLHLLLDRYRRRPCTILMITHDYSMISEISARHADLLGRIEFRELRRPGDTLELNVFEPRTYTGWLAGRAPQRPSVPSAGAPVLTADVPMEVFGRTLRVTRDAEGLQPVPLQLFGGTMAYLKAASGVGKTTLMKVLMGLLPAEHFRMHLGGLTVEEHTPRKVWREQIWGRRMTMVFQHADEALNPRSKVREIFDGLPGQPPGGTAGVGERLEEFFEGGIGASFLNRQVSALSGGQKQRLNLARGLALHTDVLLLDEPLNGLDFESIVRVIALLERKQAGGLAILMVSHNEEIIDTMVHSDHRYHLHAS